MRTRIAVFLGITVLAVSALSVTPNDPYFLSEQWPLRNSGGIDINAEAAWDVITGNPNITIGVLDTHADRDHVDLLGRVFSGGVPDNPGTRVAGIIGAKTNNAIGMAGVDWASRVQIAYGVRTSPYYTLVDGVQALRNAGCDIIHMGWRWEVPPSGPYYQPFFNSLLDAYRAGIVLVAAMPHPNENPDLYGPANFGPWVLAVAAEDYNGLPAGTLAASFTDVAAPGGDPFVTVLSTETNDTYGPSFGTNLASAHVAGVASLLLGANSAVHNYDIEPVLERTADGWPVFSQYVGYGLINAGAAVAKVVAPHCISHGTAPLTLVASNVQVTFVPYPPLPDLHTGVYWCDKYQADVTVNLDPPYKTVPWAWLKYTGYSGSNPNDAQEWMLEDVTTMSSHVRTFFYYLRFDGQEEINRWAPYDPTVAPHEYTILGAQPAFHDLNDMTTSITGNGRGVSWADYDGDGYLDLFLGSNFEPNKLFHNEKGLYFSESGVNVGDIDGVGGVWGDYDNDGDVDLYVVTEATNKLFRNTSGSLADVTASSGDANLSGVCRGTAWVDFDRDGKLDLFVARRGAPNALLKNAGDLTFTNATSVSGDASFQATGDHSGIAFGDYDKDGDDDLYVAITNGANKLFRNDGGYFVDVTSSSGPVGDAAYSTGVAWADYDNDGDLDLYVANMLSAPNHLYRNQGDGTFVDATSGPLGDTGPTVGVGWTDYDNDGDLDLYIVNDNNVADRFLRNDGGGNFVDASGTVGLAESSSGSGIAWGDLNNDGWQDVYLSKVGGAAHKILRNDMVNTTVENRWLRVKLEGQFSNRSAIGARVRAILGSSAQLRQVNGGSGYVSQNELTVAFGFGPGVTSVDTLEIRWPTGDYQRLTAVPTNTLQTVLECEGVHVSDGTMTAWAGSNPDPSFMTLHFVFNTTLNPSQFEIQYRVYPSGAWVPLVCAGSGGQCTLNGTSCGRTTSYYPCAYRKFEWRARAHNCNAWQKWSQVKTFEAFCLEEL